ncbi:MAG: TIGR00730 family Rossman fold protein, partial [Phycisphaerales bacterium]|nr:TIGR00730 family Rossman fold protein [Phycisphaerales bacterium]
VLASEGLRVVYGGGATGLMGAVADAALSKGGRVLGVIPGFMEEVEWGHKGVTELRVVDDMHERLRHMKQESDAFVSLTGGCGTFDELFQTLTWKRLGLHTGPIVIVNTNGYYDPTIAQLERAVSEGFMDTRHAGMWSVVADADAIPTALHDAPEWTDDSISFARPQ